MLIFRQEYKVGCPADGQGILFIEVGEGYKRNGENLTTFPTLITKLF